MLFDGINNKERFPSLVVSSVDTNAHVWEFSLNILARATRVLLMFSAGKQLVFRGRQNFFRLLSFFKKNFSTWSKQAGLVILAASACMAFIEIPDGCGFSIFPSGLQFPNLKELN